MCLLVYKYIYVVLVVEFDIHYNRRCEWKYHGWLKLKIWNNYDIHIH